MEDRFQCAVCKDVFTKGRSDEEAIADLERDFPGTEVSQCGVVCSSCFAAMFGLEPAS